MQKLPKSDYRWLSEIETSKFDIDSIDLDGDLGFIVQCDLIYPKKIHNNLHNCLTLAPECLEISDSCPSFSEAIKSLVPIKLIPPLFPLSNM